MRLEMFMLHWPRGKYQTLRHGRTRVQSACPLATIIDRSSHMRVAGYRSTTLLALLALAATAIAAPAIALSAVPDYITKAVADPSRPEDDRKDDANRKPAEVL